jgi:hypothetical protein
LRLENKALGYAGTLLSREISQTKTIDWYCSRSIHESPAENRRRIMTHHEQSTEVATMLHLDPPEALEALLLHYLVTERPSFIWNIH